MWGHVLVIKTIDMIGAICTLVCSGSKNMAGLRIGFHSDHHSILIFLLFSGHLKQALGSLTITVIDGAAEIQGVVS